MMDTQWTIMGIDGHDGHDIPLILPRSFAVVGSGLDRRPSVELFDQREGNSDARL